MDALHSQNPEAPQVPQETVPGGRRHPPGLSPQRADTAHQVRLFTRGTTGALRNALSPMCPFHAPEQAEEHLWRPQPVLPFGFETS